MYFSPYILHFVFYMHTIRWEASAHKFAEQYEFHYSRRRKDRTRRVQKKTDLLL